MKSGCFNTYLAPQSYSYCAPQIAPITCSNFYPGPYSTSESVKFLGNSGYESCLSPKSWKISAPHRIRVSIQGQQGISRHSRHLYLHALRFPFFISTYDCSPYNQILIPVQGRLTIVSGRKKISFEITSSYQYPFNRVSDFLSSGTPFTCQFFDVNLVRPFSLSSRRESVLKYSLSFYVRGDLIIHGQVGYPQALSSRGLCLQIPFEGIISSCPLSSVYLQNIVQYLEEAFCERSRRKQEKALRRLDNLSTFLSRQMGFGVSEGCNGGSAGGCNGSAGGSGGCNGGCGGSVGGQINYMGNCEELENISSDSESVSNESESGSNESE